ncbi:PilZ domain-containing protein [Sphingomonas sp. RS6]
MAIAARLYQDGRWAERHQVELEATLRDSDWAPVDVSIDDLSNGGFRISAGTRLVVGEMIALGIAGVGTRPAKVVWGANGSYGCEFATPLTDAELRTAFAAPLAQPIAFPKTPLPSPSPPATTAINEEQKLPVRTRVAIIFGSAVVAWVLVFAIGWAVIAAVQALLG